MRLKLIIFLLSNNISQVSAINHFIPDLKKTNNVISKTSDNISALQLLK